jgi:tetratricopeptide (TPR) repeat protein
VRGEANEDKGLHAQAIADYTAMIKLDPKSAFALGRRGLSYERLGQMLQAAADYREALKLSPDLKDAADGLARVETAMAAPAKPAAPDAAAIIAEGLADAQKRDFAAANDAFLKALALKPDAPQILFDLGLAEAQMPGYELRAIAWFKLYLMHAPDAANAAAVHTQLAAMETAYEDKLGTIADGLEQVFKQRQAQHPLSSYQPSTAESLKSIATSVGWELAEIRFAIGDSSGAVASLKRNNGAGWQAEWSKYWQAYAAQKPIAVGSVEHLPEAVAAGGGLDQAYDMLHQAYNAGAVAFFLEQGDKARAQKLAGGEIAARQMTGCPADAAQDQADGDFAERCRAGRWWSTGREAYLLSIAKNGVMLDTDYQENRLPDYLKSEELDTNDLQFAFQLYPDAAATRIANLALEYRKVRGPARDR